MRECKIDISIDERKQDIINNCYIEMADMDYVTARWAYKNGIFHIFYWTSAQCIEKYMKACLLYNNKSTKKFSHNLNELYAAVCEIDEQFSEKIISIQNTTGMQPEAWHGKSISFFVEYLNKYGSPDARYSLEGTFINGPVIHALDQFCALIRQFIRHHNYIDDDLFRLSEEKIPYHERIGVNRDWMLNSDLLLERLFAERYQAGQDRTLRNTFRNMNLSFFDERTPDESTFGGLHLSESALKNNLIRLATIDQSEENLRIIAELRDWADANIKLPKDVRDALRKKR